MKRFYETNNQEDSISMLCCKLTMDDVSKAEKEFQKYMGKKGKTYNLDDSKVPKVSKFFALYFGTSEDNEFGYYTAPEKYICSNKNVAERFMSMASMLRYHDTFNQHWCNVELDGNIIMVIYGDY